MGGAIDSDINPCDGSDVLAELNAVFNDPNSARYKFAQRNNSFGAIRNAPGNYRALVEAYETAGVDDINGWAAYLRRLGTGPGGPQKIYGIAQVRHMALTQGVATLTTIHAHGANVDTPNGLQSISSPSPLVTIEEKAAAKPASKPDLQQPRSGDRRGGQPGRGSPRPAIQLKINGGMTMGGGAIDRDIYPCDGSDVLAELNAVFNDPNSARYKFAQRNNSFGAIKNAPGNYRALIEAYETAGVDDINGWAAYLRRLGTGPGGPQKIYGIAQVRNKALTQGVATLTTIHAQGVQVDTPNGLQLISSPSPLATIEEKAAAKPAYQATAIR